MGTAATREYLVGSITIEGLYTMPPSYGIGPEDVTGCLRAQGTELRPVDVVPGPDRADAPVAGSGQLHAR
jgi:hypothetical protein